MTSKFLHKQIIPKAFSFSLLVSSPCSVLQIYHFLISISFD